MLPVGVGIIMKNSHAGPEMRSDIKKKASEFAIIPMSVVTYRAIIPL